MTDGEKLTIVVVTQDHVDSIDRSLHSITTGLRLPDHIIIANNDGKDGTYEFLCDRLGAPQVTQDDKTGLSPKFQGEINGVPITIFRKEKSSLGHSINTSLYLAPRETTIFGFLNPRDWYAPDKIIRSMASFRIDPAIGCVVSDCDEHQPDGRIVRVFRPSFNQVVLMNSYPYDRNFFIRRTVFEKLGVAFNMQLLYREDYELLLRASEIGLIYHIPESLHNRIFREENEDAINAEHMIRQLTSQRRQQLGQTKK